MLTCSISDRESSRRRSVGDPFSSASPIDRFPGSQNSTEYRSRGEYTLEHGQFVPDMVSGLPDQNSFHSKSFSPSCSNYNASRYAFMEQLLLRQRQHVYNMAMIAHHSSGTPMDETYSPLFRNSATYAHMDGNSFKAMHPVNNSVGSFHQVQNDNAQIQADAPKRNINDQCSSGNFESISQMPMLSRHHSSERLPGQKDVLHTLEDHAFPCREVNDISSHELIQSVCFHSYY